MDEGLVVKGLGVLFCKKEHGSLIRCKARVVLKENINIFVGDKVKIIRTIDNTWVIEEIMPRTNFIIRPPVA